LPHRQVETIQDLIYQTVDEGKKPRAEIAEDCGDLYSHFSRKINPNDPVKFPAEQLIPLIRSTRDPRILHFIVRHTSDITGLILVKDRPRKIAHESEEYAHTMTIMTDVQKAYAKWLSCNSEVEDLIKQIDRLRAELIRLRKAVVSGNRQKELSF
jgi:hypothetical protein